jgi:ribosomal-protein-alanine N-acetyltransferase
MFGRPLKIRDFHSGDPEILHEIDHICFPADIAFSRGELLFYLNHAGSITRVAESSGRIVGFVLGRIENRRHARIITLDVVPEAHRQGIGLALMEDIHRILKSRRILASVLEVGTGNLAARSLYERMQYRYVENLPGYYNGNEDAYRMALVFDYGLGT